ncbi:toxic anion resistance protein [Rheinheimera baltica]|uniref:toxic anion resistance protein n=1 Tax=Rheinheimera baltica TaxID=67576 RepID=UPI00273D68C9|nr:toxic anion resistance protein [Rheinheimera baltica]MDP5144721.1 toxic anion resistance protein [Rheinheimera baltica]
MTTSDVSENAALQAVTADMLSAEVDTPAQQQVPADIIQAADQVVAQLFAVDVDNETAKQQAVQSVETMGLKLQQEASRRSEILKQPIATLARNSEDGGPVAKSLLDLRDTVEDLDPNQYDFSMSGLRRLLSLVPGVGTAMRRYFSKFQSASGVIDNIIDALDKGAEQLKRDNITLADDQKFLQQLTKKLAQAVVLGQQIDLKLSARLNELLKDDPRYAFIEQELLFPLRQRIMDLQQQQAVAQQAVLTVEVIIRNNKELIRGVQRALNVTVTALQTAVTLALALENQRITLAKVTAVNETTNKLIAGTASKLRTQGVAIHKQAAATQLDIAVLRTAFADIAAALDDIQQFRRDALPQMQQNITEMEQANLANAERIESLLKGRDSQAKLGLGSQIDQLFELDNKE